jgi:hypothetical protein
MTGPQRGRPLTPEEVAAIALLARGGRALVILIPEGIPQAEIKQLMREVDARLSALAESHNVDGWAEDDRGPKPN